MATAHPEYLRALDDAIQISYDKAASYSKAVQRTGDYQFAKTVAANSITNALLELKEKAKRGHS